jgi:hypothetical protein
MTYLRRALALAGAAALAVTLAPGAAQADDPSDKVFAPEPAQGPALKMTDERRNWLAPDSEDLISPFFAGHVRSSDDNDELNTAEFLIHDWECGAEDDGILSSMLTYDDFGFFNGGPGIFMYCTEGEKVYAPVFLDFAFGQIPITEDVAPGDRVVMTASRSGGVATYTMENTTQGWSASADGTGDFVNASVETGDAAMTLGGTPLPPPAFGRDAVKRVQFDGVDLSDSGSQKVQMVAEDGTTIIERATKHRAALNDERFTLINYT